jgi:hypothetical protein
MGLMLRYSFVKPLLHDIQNVERLKLVLNQLEITRDGNYRIKDMKNVVHVEEKWFYTSKVKGNVREFSQEQPHSG